jgi:hypothetical protein
LLFFLLHKQTKIAKKTLAVSEKPLTFVGIKS